MYFSFDFSWCRVFCPSWYCLLRTGGVAYSTKFLKHDKSYLLTDPYTFLNTHPFYIVSNVSNRILQFLWSRSLNTDIPQHKSSGCADLQTFIFSLLLLFDVIVTIFTSLCYLHFLLFLFSLSIYLWYLFPMVMLLLPIVCFPFSNSSSQSSAYSVASSYFLQIEHIASLSVFG